MSALPKLVFMSVSALKGLTIETAAVVEGEQLEVRFTDGSSLIVGPMVRNEPTVQYSTNGHRGSWGYYG